MHQALYRKYRPACFEDVVGQSHVTRTLQAQSVSGRLSHAYLFCGPRGTGKTTCARILAKAANCLNPKNGDPCNECEACRAINEGNATDVFEMDAATYTGVDDIRALRAEAVYSPASLRKKVYIIDEVHMLSVSAFNAFLKILEEPPAHVMFVLASTELQKIPATILSRCQRFEFARITREDIAAQLLKVAAAEQIELEPGGAALIAAMSDGAMRNALSLLEQAAAQGGQHLDARTVSGALGVASNESLFGVMNAIAAGNASEAIRGFDAAYGEGAEPESFFDQLLCLSRDILMAENGIQGSVTGAGYGSEDLKEFLNIPGEQLYYIVKALSACLWALPKSVNKRVDGEMALYGLCTPSVQGDNGALAARVAALEQKMESGYVPAMGATVPLEQQKSAGKAEIQENFVNAVEKQTEIPGIPVPGLKVPGESGQKAAGGRERFVLAQSLVSALGAKLKGPAQSMLEFCKFFQEQHTLIAVTGDDMVYEWLNKPEILTEMQKLAAELDGDIKVAKMVLEMPELKRNGKTQKSNENLDNLMEELAKNSEIVTIH